MISTAVIIAGLGFLVLAAATVAWFRRVQRVAIPANRLGFLLLWLLALSLGVCSFFSPGAGWPSGVLGGLAAVGGGLFLTLYALGKQRAASPIAVGDQMPAFSATDGDRALFDSASLGGAPILLKFFRGHW